MTATLSTELRDFLTREKRFAKVGTRRTNGDPWVQPAWFDVDGDDIIQVIDRNSLLGQSVMRERKVCLCVDDVVVPYGFAVLEGSVTVIVDAELGLSWMGQLVRKYRQDVADVIAHARMLRDDFGLTPVRIELDGIYFEPVVAPPPASSSSEGTSG